MDMRGRKAELQGRLLYLMCLLESNLFMETNEVNVIGYVECLEYAE